MTVTPILGLEKADGPDITKDYLKVALAGSLDTLDNSVINPMTTPGDLIRGGTAGAPTRLGKGADGQVLAVVGGLLTWVTPAPAAPAAHHATHEPGGSDPLPVDAAVGTGSLRTLGTGAVQAAVGNHAHAGTITNPMTTLGDLIAGGASGAPGRLGVGTEGQVLSVASGAPAWAAPPTTDSLLTNGGMEVWQRGNGPFTGIAAYTADRWQLSLVGGSTASVSRDSANADAGSLYCAAVVYTHVAASRLLQVVEPWAQLRWRTVTFAVRVRTATASAVRLSVWDSVNGFRYSADHTGSGGYELLAVTAPIGAGATGVQVSVDLGASCTAYVDNATLVAGSAVLPYVPLHPADDLGRCLRYYEVLGGGDPFESLFIGQATAATNAKVSWAFKAVKAGTPTLAFSAVGDFFVQSAAANLTPTGITFTQATPRSVLVSFAVASGLTANNAVAVCAASSSCRLAAESNV